MLKQRIFLAAPSFPSTDAHPLRPDTERKAFSWDGRYRRLYLKKADAKYVTPAVSAILGGSFASLIRPHLASVKRSSRSERPEAVLFERSEFTDDSERRVRSSEAGAALIF